MELSEINLPFTCLSFSDSKTVFLFKPSYLCLQWQSFSVPRFRVLRAEQVDLATRKGFRRWKWKALAGRALVMRNVHTATNLWQMSAARSLLRNAEHPWNSEAYECSSGSASWVNQGQMYHNTCQINTLVSLLYQVLLCPQELLGGKRGKCGFSAARTWLKGMGRKCSKSETL